MNVIFLVSLLFVLNPDGNNLKCNSLDSFQAAASISNIKDMQHDDQNLFHYLPANNDSFLYIIMTTNDALLQKKIVQYGLTTWIDPENTENKTLGIEYPMIRAEFSGGYPGQGPQDIVQTGTFNDMQNQIIEQSGSMFIRGFSSEDEIIGTGELGFDGSLYFDESNQLWILLQIPLKSCPGNLDKPFSILFETGYLNLEQSMAMQQSERKKQGRSGRYGGKRGAPSRPDIEYMQTPAKLSVKSIILSK